MSRIITNGRNSWKITNTHRCHSVRIPGELQPMDSERTNTLSWFILAMFVALFITPLIMGAA